MDLRVRYFRHTLVLSCIRQCGKRGALRAIAGARYSIRGSRRRVEEHVYCGLHSRQALRALQSHWGRSNVL